MRKLAVTLFALSLAALGCGSDSGTKTPDSAVSPDGGKTPDAYVAPGVDAGPTPDTSSTGAEVQVQVDTQKVETQVADAPVDQAQIPDTAPLDGLKGIDVQGIDGTKPVLDGGADAPKIDADAAADADSVDGGTVG